MIEYFAIDFHLARLNFSTAALWYVKTEASPVSPAVNAATVELKSRIELASFGKFRTVIRFEEDKARSCLEFDRLIKLTFIYVMSTGIIYRRLRGIPGFANGFTMIVKTE